MNKIIAAVAIGAISLGVMAAISRGAVAQDAAVPAPVSATDSNTVPAQVSVPAPVSSATSTAVPAPVTTTTPTSPSDVSVTPVPGTVAPVVVPDPPIVETKPPAVAPVPPIVDPVPGSVTPVPPVVETEPGAMCKTYYPRKIRALNNKFTVERQDQEAIDDVLNAIGSGETAPDVGFDAKGTAFDAANIAKDPFVAASWDGVFEAKTAGEYDFRISAIYPYSVTVNGQTIKGCGNNGLKITLVKGLNKISIVRIVFTYQDLKLATSRFRHSVAPSEFSIKYRYSSSIEPASPITPSMLMHVVAD